jgi:hypothetical protein
MLKPTYLLLTMIICTIMPNHLMAISDLNIDPAYLKLKVYKFAVSTSVFCTNPVTVFTNDNPTYVDVLQSPTFGSGSLADGTYHCVLIEFSDNIKYQPSADSSSGNCQTSTDYTLDVCQSGSSSMIDGTSTSCTTGENRVTMFLSTTSTATSGTVNAFTAPQTTNDSSHGFNLGSALTVNGTGSGSFVVNGTDKVCDSASGNCPGSGCEMQPPIFSFSN